jgi:hypothetical protein|nr:MAG TPA: hypothetical protein [Caudoviricetes sp.]
MFVPAITAVAIAYGLTIISLIVLLAKADHERDQLKTSVDLLIKAQVKSVLEIKELQAEIREKN